MTDVIIELKIKNPSDWDIIQPLLQRLKISFAKKETELSTLWYKNKNIIH